MAARHDRSYRSFDEVTSRLDEIVRDVRSKDTSLERSLDLFDEAIGLGTKAVELVDRTDFSPEEKERLAHLSTKDQVEAEEGAGGNVAEDLLTEEGREAVADGEGMATPAHPMGENAAQAAIERAESDADDGAWADGAPEA